MRRDFEERKLKDSKVLHNYTEDARELFLKLDMRSMNLISVAGSQSS